MENLKIKTQEEQNTTIKNFKAGAGITFATDRDEVTISANGGGSSENHWHGTFGNLMHMVRNIQEAGGTVLCADIDTNSTSNNIVCNAVYIDTDNGITQSTTNASIANQFTRRIPYNGNEFVQVSSQGTFTINGSGVGRFWDMEYAVNPDRMVITASKTWTSIDEGAEVTIYFVGADQYAM